MLRLHHITAAALGAMLLQACAGDGTTGPVNDPPANLPGTIALTMRTAGIGMDADGYTVTVDGVARGAVAAKGTTWIRAVPPGIAEVELAGVSAECSVTGGNPRSVAVPVGEVVRVTVEVACGAEAAPIEP
jgi:hypothetical protein